MKICDWIATHPGRLATVPAGASLREIADLMLADPALRDVYVRSEDRRLLGHISRERVAQCLLAEHRRTHTRSQLIERVAGGAATELMDTHFVTARREEELEDVLHRQLEHLVEDMPVVDDSGTVLGGISLTAVLEELRET